MESAVAPGRRQAALAGGVRRWTSDARPHSLTKENGAVNRVKGQYAAGREISFTVRAAECFAAPVSSTTSRAGFRRRSIRGAGELTVSTRSLPAAAPAALALSGARR